MKLSINQRLTAIVKDYLKIEQQVFATRIGIKPNTFGNYLSGETRTPAEVFEQIKINYPEISSDWLLVGEGAMLKGETSILNENDIHYFKITNEKKEKTFKIEGNENAMQIGENTISYGESDMLREKLRSMEELVAQLRKNEAHLLGQIEFLQKQLDKK